MPEQEQPPALDDRWVGDPAGDAFEATLTAAEEPYDARLQHVMTVLGPIPPAALGLTVVTRHWPSADLAPAALLAELEAAYALGLRAIWVSDTLDDARQHDVRWLAARAPIHLIAGPVAGQALADPPALATGHRIGEPAVASPRPLPVAGADVYPVAGVNDAYRVAVGDRVALLEATAGAVAAAWATGDEHWLAGFADDPVTLLERLPLALMGADLTAVAVRQILVENPALALTITPADGDDRSASAPAVPRA